MKSIIESMTIKRWWIYWYGYGYWLMSGPKVKEGGHKSRTSQILHRLANGSALLHHLRKVLH